MNDTQLIKLPLDLKNTDMLTNNEQTYYLIIFNKFSKNTASALLSKLEAQGIAQNNLISVDISSIVQKAWRIISMSHPKLKLTHLEKHHDNRANTNQQTTCINKQRLNSLEKAVEQMIEADVAEVLQVEKVIPLQELANEL